MGYSDHPALVHGSHFPAWVSHVSGVIDRSGLLPDLPGTDPVAALRDLLVSQAPLDMRERLAAVIDYAIVAHDGQTRRSGEPYITHPLSVAIVCQRAGFGPDTILAAICHDLVEDCNVTLEDLTTVIGEPAARLVDGVTRIDKMPSVADPKAANLRKMVMALAGDYRVLAVKLADRLHNLATLSALPEEKRTKIASESLLLYAPLAHRLGVETIRRPLEDLSFAHLHPDEFVDTATQVAAVSPEGVERVDQACSLIAAELTQRGIRGEVTGRDKHLFSVWRKTRIQRCSVADLWDLQAVRVILDEVVDCYATLGIVHELWTPVPGRFRDYIALPKFNLYQSLHATVLGPGGTPLEIQIRTREMHDRATRGGAAHFAYKEGSSFDASEMDWVRRLVEWGDSADGEFVDGVETELGTDEVHVFTPAGDVMSLPAGATAIDFAYAIHSEVGDRCAGVRVNAKLQPIRDPLPSGAVVEVITRPTAAPSKDWLDHVVTARARNRIRQHFARSRREADLTVGRQKLGEDPAAKQIFTTPALAEHVCTALGFKDIDTVCVAVGAGRVSVAAVADKVMALTSPKPRRRSRRRHSQQVTVLVAGSASMKWSPARCCTPAPPVPVVGYVTRTRGLSVHRADCADVAGLRDSSPDRIVAVAWQVNGPAHTVQVRAGDRPGLLRDLSDALSGTGANILAASTRTAVDGEVQAVFEFTSAEDLTVPLASLRQVPGVWKVTPVAADSR